MSNDAKLDNIHSNTKKVGRSNKPINISGNSTNNQCSEKGKRPTKNITYATEQKEISKKILSILGIDNNNKIFYINDINEDPEKVNQIISLENDIKKYFKCGTWTYFAKQIPMPWLSLTRSVLKYTGYDVKSVSVRLNETIKVIKKGFLVNI